MIYAEKRRCISVTCGRVSTIEVETSDGNPPGPNVVDDALHAIGWREGVCDDCTGLGPKQ